MNLAEIFVEVCINKVDIFEACLGFSDYRIVGLLTLKEIIMTTADNSLLFFFRANLQTIHMICQV